jgi:hypothetical protein
MLLILIGKPCTADATAVRANKKLQTSASHSKEGICARSDEAATM